QGERCVCADVRRQNESSDLGIGKIRRAGLGRPLDQFLAVDDLHDAVLVGAVTEIDAIAGGTGRDRTMPFNRHLSPPARVLSVQTEVADEPRLRRIGKVIDLRHPPNAPTLHAGDEIGDAAVAFPPVLVRALDRADPRDELRLRRIADVPDLVVRVTEGAQQIKLRRIALRQLPAAAHANHLRAAALALTFFARNVREILRRARIRNVEYRRAVEIGCAREHIHWLGRLVRAAVVTDVQDPAAVLLANERLIGAARLQIVEAEQRHALRFRRRGLRAHGGRWTGERDGQDGADDNGLGLHREPPFRDARRTAADVIAFASHRAVWLLRVAARAAHRAAARAFDAPPLPISARRPKIGRSDYAAR